MRDGVLDTLLAGGVPAWIDKQHAIARAKIVVIHAGTPDAAVETGSFNFTNAAENSNAENELTIDGAPELADRYEADFERHRGHSEGAAT